MADAVIATDASTRKTVKDYGYIFCKTCGERCKRNNAPQRYCAPCRHIARNEAKRKWERENPEEHAANQRAQAARWRANNPEKHKSSLAAAKKRWNEKNPDKVREHRKASIAKRRATPRGRIDHNLSVAVRDSLSGRKKGQRWQVLVGYTVVDLMRHLERQFMNGMSWENYGEWHIDHIIPLASFTYTSPHCEQFKAAWAITNLRPLWRLDNLQKNKSRTLLL